MAKESMDDLSNRVALQISEAEFTKMQREAIEALNDPSITQFVLFTFGANGCQQVYSADPSILACVAVAAAKRAADRLT